MSIENLFRLLPPPASPRENRGDWREVERTIGTVLPEDYKAFINAYGSGRINNLLWVLNPFTPNVHLNLMDELVTHRNNIEALRHEFAIPFLPVFPEPGGVLPCAMTDNGDVLYWRSNGSPKEWSIVAQASRMVEYEVFGCNLADFLVRILTKRNACSAFPEDFCAGQANFEVKKD